MKTPEQWLTWAKFATGRGDVQPQVAPDPLASLSAGENKLPAPSTAAEIRSYVSPQELLRMHNQLHREYGSSPEPKVVKAERMITAAMQSFGVPHRHKDQLAQEARTAQDRLPPLSVGEISLHLDDLLHIETGAVSLVQDEDAGRQIYLRVSKTLSPLARAIQIKINRSLPPTANLPVFPTGRSRPGHLARTSGLFDLCLRGSYAPSKLQSWESLDRAELALEDTEDAMIGKTLELNALEAYVGKASATSETVSDLDEERFVKGVVLEPGVVDKTRVQLEDGTLTEGDAYDAPAVRDACHYWMENSRVGARLHTKQGGTFLRTWEACLLENYITDGPTVIGGRKVRAGTWVQAWRIYDDQLWQDIRRGNIKAFSMGAWSKAVVEPVE